MPALPPKLQTLNGFRVVYPAYMVWNKQQLLEAFREEKLKQAVGCVCACVCACVCVCVCVCVKAFQSMCVVNNAQPSASEGQLDCFCAPSMHRCQFCCLKGLFRQKRRARVDATPWSTPIFSNHKKRARVDPDSGCSFPQKRRA